MTKIYVLTDNHAQREFKAEWGLSFFIETGGTSILFDFGDSDLFLKNAAKLGIDPLSAEHYVLSHGHWDHGNGLQYMPSRKLVCHPEVFIKRYRGKKYLGLPYSHEEAEQKFDLVLTASPYRISENAFFLGEITRQFDFEDIINDFVKEDGSMDPVVDDSGIVLTGDKGLIVISGCAHAGICNTVEHAKAVTGVNKVQAVLGGFHLKGGDKQCAETISYLKGLNAEYISTSHCTQFPALVEFANELGSRPFMAGQIIEL
ncbi:MAG TPA: MBL fold metallo-hydrolase [Spirochaetota bacterium]|nr:MBL fold metallo-hydrolase [Spirochaetota bacterium]HPJ34851.1 MBL fold metallo-hydrolase [Spirochaetota bacterium]